MNRWKNPKGKSPTFRAQREKEEPLKREKGSQRTGKRTRRKALGAVKREMSLGRGLDCPELKGLSLS